MRRALLVSLRMALATVVLVGVIYPLVVWGIAVLAFPHQAAGSLVTRADGSTVGSQLIAQSFAKPGYFRPRPSAAGTNGYDAMASSPSNLGPTNKVLVSTVTTRVAETVAADGAHPGAIPVDAVTSSGSGLDPDITPDNAAMQVARVARERRMTPAAVQALVAAHTAQRQLGFLGEPRVNVLELNLALDAAGK